MEGKQTLYASIQSSMLMESNRVNHPILDSMKHVAAVLVAKPQDGSYDASVQEVFNLMERLGSTNGYIAKDFEHPRGPSPAINIGIALWPGCDEPQRLRMGSLRAVMTETLPNDRR